MRTILLSIITLCSLLVSACSPPMPARNPPSHDEMLDMIGSQWEERKPIRTIKLPSTFFLSRPLRGGLPEELSELPFNAYFPEGDATIDDIIALLDYQGLPVAFYWENTDAIDEIKARSINFRRYNGTLGGFLRKIEKTVDVAHWWDDDTLFLATTQRYVVTIPQEETTSSIIEDELSNLGASEIFRSVHGGQMIYSAPPRLNEEILVPFLRRISQNFCEVTMQIALVTVTITDTLNRGFDWNAFNMTINTKQDGRISDEDDEGSLTTISSQQIIHNLLRRGFPIFGSETEVGISMAIAYLSQFGRTKTAQAVELRTLAGQEITIDRSTEIPYVSGYEGGTTGDNPTPPTPEFDTVDVGLEVTLTPNFDSLTGITTLSMDIKDSSVTAFTEEIQTGDYIGLVETRPIVQNQEMNDVIVRVPVGETVIIGGISSETSSDSRSTPWSIWDIARSGKDSTRTQLFIIIRPLVTLYEVEGNEILLADKFAPKTQRHASVTPGMMMLSTVDVPIDPVDAALAEPVDAALVEPDTDVPVPFFKGLIQGLTNLKDVGDFDVGPWESR